jgi:hypothetical protein
MRDTSLDHPGRSHLHNINFDKLLKKQFVKKSLFYLIKKQHDNRIFSRIFFLIVRLKKKLDNKYKITFEPFYKIKSYLPSAKRAQIMLIPAMNPAKSSIPPS